MSREKPTECFRAPAVGWTLHEGPSAFTVIPAQSFEFRGPFGTPAHAGKSGAVARRGRCFLAQRARF
jgi:hypothetical protein